MKDPKDERHDRLTDLQARGLNVRGLAIPWFTPASWARMREVAADRDNLPEGFAEFERLAGDRLADLVARGHPAERLVMSVENIDDLIALCRARGAPLDARARSVFAALMLSEQARHAGHG